MVLHEVGGGWDESLGGLCEPVQEGAVLGFEAAALGVGEAGGGNPKGGEVVEGLADALDARLEPDREGAEGLGPLGLGTDGRERVTD